MTVHEVLERLDAWKQETENKDVLYVDFHCVKTAMRGSVRNRRVVDNYEVAAVLAQCYVDPKMRGQSYFVSTEEKEEYEEAERAGRDVVRAVETEKQKHVRALKQVCSGVSMLDIHHRQNHLVLEQHLKGVLEQAVQNQDRLASLKQRLNELNSRGRF